MKLFGGSGRNSNNSGRTAENNIRRESSERRESKKKTSAVKVILIILLVIALLFGGVFAYWKLTTKPPEVVPPPVGDDGDPVEEAPSGNRYYYTLVVGEDQLGSNTDTIMLVRYDSYENTANILSIPRDTIVNVPWRAKRINAVYYNGGDGINSLLTEVSRITGCYVTNYVIVNMQVFIDVVNAMDGVWFDVPRDMNYGDYALDNYGNPYEFTINVDKGYQKLNGYDAIGVFRFRQNSDGTGYAGGDWDRIEVQHNLMMAIAEQALATRNVVRLMDIVSSVFGNCETNLTMSNIQWYMQEFLQMTMDDISFYTMPTIGCWTNGAAYVTVNADAWVEMLNEHFNSTETEIKAEDLPLLQARDPEIDRHSITPSNYYVTNGDEAYTNF